MPSWILKIFEETKMKLKFEKVKGNPYEAFYIYVEINAVSEAEQKMAYAVQNMAYSIGYRLTKKV